MKPPFLVCLPVLCAAWISSIGSAQSAVLLSTHFDGTGTTVTTGTLSGFDYTVSNGLTGGSIALTSGNLFALGTGATASHFAPNVQVHNSQWVANLSFTVGSSPVTITSIDLERQNFNVAGALNDVLRDYPIIVSLVGSSSGSVASDTLGGDGNWPNSNATNTFEMGGVQIDNTETWSIRIQVNDGTSAGSGVFVGFDQLSVEGTVIPEPSAALLGLIGTLSLLRRRR